MMPSLAKELMLRELIKTLESKSYIFFARYQSLPAGDFAELRRKLEKVSERTLVVKNSLSRLAFKQVGINDINGLIKGSIILTVAQKDPHLISKVLLEFAKGRENFEIGGAYLEGGVFPAQYLKSLAELPSREVLLASVLGRMQGPISGFVSGLGQLMRSLAVVLDQIQKSKATS
jgi:large subunit ribosomal protein L10